jgi:hypothetical protein
MYDDHDKAPECANSNEDFRPWKPSVILRHHFEEADIADFGIAAAICSKPLSPELSAFWIELLAR